MVPQCRRGRSHGQCGDTAEYGCPPVGSVCRGNRGTGRPLSPGFVHPPAGRRPCESPRAACAFDLPRRKRSVRAFRANAPTTPAAARSRRPREQGWRRARRHLRGHRASRPDRHRRGRGCAGCGGPDTVAVGGTKPYRDLSGRRCCRLPVLPWMRRPLSDGRRSARPETSRAARARTAAEEQRRVRCAWRWRPGMPSRLAKGLSDAPGSGADECPATVLCVTPAPTAISRMQAPSAAWIAHEALWGWTSMRCERNEIEPEVRPFRVPGSQARPRHRMA